MAESEGIRIAIASAIVATVLTEVLGVPAGTEDDFFDLGRHSC